MTTKLFAVNEEHSGALCHVAQDTGIQADKSHYPNLVTPYKPDKRTHYYYSAYINRTRNIKLLKAYRPLIAPAKRVSSSVAQTSFSAKRNSTK
jgi:hypothetical protein